MTDALKIKISGNGYSDEAVIRYVAGASNGFDGNYDAWKLFSSNTAVPNIYTVDSQSDPLTINAMDMFTATQLHKIFVRIGAAATYSFIASEVAAFQPGVKITLIDAVSGLFYDLRNSDTILINLPVISINDPARFQVLFSYPDSLQVTDTTHVIVMDTLHISVTDTTHVIVQDTLFVSATDTIHVIVQDTVYVSVTDTLIIHLQLTGVSAPHDNQLVKVYPNPATGAIFIDTGNYNYLNGYSIKITNPLGQAVFQSGIGQPLYTVNLSTLGGPGNYVIQIQDPSGAKCDTRKIILQ